MSEFPHNQFCQCRSCVTERTKPSASGVESVTVEEPEFWLDDEDGTVWTWGPDSPQEMDNEEMVAELNRLRAAIRAQPKENK